VWRFGSCKSWPRRHKADGGQEAYRRACPSGGIPDSPTVELVPAEAFLIRLPSGSSRRRHSAFAYRRARPGGGVTKQLFGSGQSWPRRHEADGGQEAYRRARPSEGVTKQLSSVSRVVS
jgi:hypothetical protein